jgi:hypothetical protein
MPRLAALPRPGGWWLDRLSETTSTSPRAVRPTEATTVRPAPRRARRPGSVSGPAAGSISDSWAAGAGDDAWPSRPITPRPCAREKSSTVRRVCVAEPFGSRERHGTGDGVLGGVSTARRAEAATRVHPLSGSTSTSRMRRTSPCGLASTMVSTTRVDSSTAGPFEQDAELGTAAVPPEALSGWRAQRARQAMIRPLPPRVNAAVPSAREEPSARVAPPARGPPGRRHGDRSASRGPAPCRSGRRHEHGHLRQLGVEPTRVARTRRRPPTLTVAPPRRPRDPPRPGRAPRSAARHRRPRTRLHDPSVAIFSPGGPRTCHRPRGRPAAAAPRSDPRCRVAGTSRPWAPRWISARERRRLPLGAGLEVRPARRKW